MKFRILWGLSAAWALIFFYIGFDELREVWNSEETLLNSGKVFTSVLAGVGAFTIACLPLLGSYLLHRFHKSREHSRLVKDRNRIEKRLAKLDQSRKAPSSA